MNLSCVRPNVCPLYKYQCANDDLRAATIGEEAANTCELSARLDGLEGAPLEELQSQPARRLCFAGLDLNSFAR